MTIQFIDGFDSTYSTGGVHFLIEDDKEAYFFIKPFPENSFSICGTDIFSKEDSIRQIEFEKKYLDSIKPVSVDSVSEILLNLSTEIQPNGNKHFPALISFALKNDTLEGSFMQDILAFMENGMKAYFIRRMNENELEAIEKLKN